jgi:hypothetical protein
LLIFLYLGPYEQEKLGVIGAEYNQQKSEENSALDLLKSLNLTRDQSNKMVAVLAQI